VLAVDDQHDVAGTFAALLETLGQRGQVAYDGADARAHASP
jgi:CheY-like chemotaxis protein